MTDLIKQLQYLSRVTKDYDQEHMTSADYEMIPAATKQAADRIEELAEDNQQLINSLGLINVAWDQALGQRDAAEAKLAKAVEALRWAYDTLKEINTRNYTHDDVCNLNDASVDVIIGIGIALAELEKME